MNEVKIKLTTEENKIFTNESQKRNINLADLIKHLALLKIDDINMRQKTQKPTKH